MSHTQFRALVFTALLIAAFGFPASARAAPPEDPDPDLRQTVEDLKKDMKAMKEDYEQKINALHEQLKEKTAPEQEEGALLESMDEMLDRMDSMNAEVDLLKSSGGGKAAYIDVSFNTLVTAGTSTAPEDVIVELEGGHHDPHKRGFTLQNAELYLFGAVDPYFSGASNIVLTINEEGESVVELEEAYLKTTSLPAGLQVKAGQFFVDFGRINPQHPHQWEFVDQPVVNTRFFGGDGLRGPGARVSWLTPVCFPLEAEVGMLNANGETATSFLSGDDEVVYGGFHDRSVRTISDLITTARLAASTDLTDELPVQIGASGAWGPSGATSDRSTSIVGVDFVAKWRPLATDLGFPFVAFQTEWMWRHYPYDAFTDPDTGTGMPGGTIRDRGGYAQLVWGFTRDWTVGARWDHAVGPFSDVFGLDDRDRESVALTYYPSHFSKIRLQVNTDQAQSLGQDYLSIWLQLEINFGAHGAHKF